MQRRPGDCAGDVMSGRRTILRRRMPDKIPPLHVQLVLGRYIESQNVSRRWRLDWEQLRRPPTVGSPPAEMNICKSPDNPQTEISVI